MFHYICIYIYIKNDESKSGWIPKSKHPSLLGGLGPFLLCIYICLMDKYEMYWNVKLGSSFRFADVPLVPRWLIRRYIWNSQIWYELYKHITSVFTYICNQNFNHLPGFPSHWTSALAASTWTPAVVNPLAAPALPCNEGISQRPPSGRNVTFIHQICAFSFECAKGKPS